MAGNKKSPLWMVLFIAILLCSCQTAGEVTETSPLTTQNTEQSEEHTPAPTPTPTLAPTPTTIPTPAASSSSSLDFSEEPPLDDFSASIAVPDFLTEEQQNLYRRAYSLYGSLFGGDTNQVEYVDIYSPHEHFDLGYMTYLISNGRYALWDDFYHVVHAVFTASFFEKKNSFGDGYEIYINHDGKLAFLDLGRGTGICRNRYYPDTFELIEQSEDRIRFYVVGYYSYLYPYPGESFEERDARLQSNYEYTDRFEIVMVNTESGWRFDSFFTTGIDEREYDEMKK